MVEKKTQIFLARKTNSDKLFAMKTMIQIDGFTCAPVPDTQELAEKGTRTMLRVSPRSGTIEIFEAEKGVLTSGWVVGVTEK